MLAQLTFGQEIWLAVIQGIGVLLGVLGGLAIGIWQAARRGSASPRAEDRRELTSDSSPPSSTRRSEGLTETMRCAANGSRFTDA
jgi:hypothetical protein